MTGTDPVSRIAAALRSLPLLPGMEKHCDDIARGLVMRATFLAMQDRPHLSGNVEEKRAAKELDTFAKLAAKLARHMEGMSATSVRAMRHRAPVGPLPSHEALLRDLQVMTAAAGAAGENLAPFAVRKTGTKPPKPVAAFVAGSLGESFKALTGNPPSRRVNAKGEAYGPFVELVTEAFEALAIDASPAAAAAKCMQKSTSKKGR